MSLLGILFCFVCAIAMLVLPRKCALLPVLAGVCLMPLAQGIEIGPFHFPIFRLLILVGFIRVVLRGEWQGMTFLTSDRLLILWALWFAVAALFHKEPTSTLVNYLGHIYNAVGPYFLVRCFCRTNEDLVTLVKLFTLVMIPLALEMVYEQLTKHNAFSVFGGVPAAPEIRGGRVRSQGPFLHAILAGTAGAACFPFMIAIWRSHRKYALTGIATCLVIIAASASSGPILTLLLGLGGMIFWRWRHLTKHMLILAALVYLALGLVMSRPAYYIITYVDLTGSSTSWHRARIIEAAFEHLSEWWLVGTDYTRHWMPYGVSWSEDQSDITNHYLGQGVKGGLLQMFLFMAIMWQGFRNVGRTLRLADGQPENDQFLLWSFGASLFAHALTFMSIAYWDQTSSFVYIDIAVAASFSANTLLSATDEERLGAAMPFAPPNSCFGSGVQ